MKRLKKDKPAMITIALFVSSVMNLTKVYQLIRRWRRAQDSEWPCCDWCRACSSENFQAYFARATDCLSNQRHQNAFKNPQLDRKALFLNDDSQSPPLLPPFSFISLTSSIALQDLFMCVLASRIVRKQNLTASPNFQSIPRKPLTALARP